MAEVNSAKQSASNAMQRANSAMNKANSVGNEVAATEAKTQEALDLANTANQRAMTPGPQGLPGTPADMIRVLALEEKVSTSGSAVVNVGLIGAGVTIDVPIPFLKPMPNTNYIYSNPLIANTNNITLGNFVITFKSKAVDKITFTVKNNTLLSLTGSFVLGVNVQGN